MWKRLKLILYKKKKVASAFQTKKKKKFTCPVDRDHLYVMKKSFEISHHQMNHFRQKWKRNRRNKMKERNEREGKKQKKKKKKVQMTKIQRIICGDVA